MNFKKTIAQGLLVIAPIFFSINAFSATGTIILRDKDQGQCALPVPPPGQTFKYYFWHEADSPTPNPCAPRFNDKARSIQLAEVPSATNIILDDAPKCANNENFRAEFVTTNKSTSTSIFEIEELNSYQPGQIIQRGLQMTKQRFSHPGAGRDSLSCMIVSTSSEAPPTTTTP